MQLLIFLTVTGLPSVRDSKVKKAAAAVRKGEHGTRCGLSWKEEKQAVVTERTNNDCYYCSSATSSSAPNAVFWGWTPLDATDNKVVIMCFPHLQPPTAVKQISFKLFAKHIRLSRTFIGVCWRVIERFSHHLSSSVVVIQYMEPHNRSFTDLC